MQCKSEMQIINEKLVYSQLGVCNLYALESRGIYSICSRIHCLYTWSTYLNNILEEQAEQKVCFKSPDISSGELGHHFPAISSREDNHQELICPYKHLWGHGSACSEYPTINKSF